MNNSILKTVECGSSISYNLGAKSGTTFSLSWWYEGLYHENKPCCGLILTRWIQSCRALRTKLSGFTRWVLLNFWIRIFNKYIIRLNSIMRKTIRMFLKMGFTNLMHSDFLLGLACLVRRLQQAISSFRKTLWLFLSMELGHEENLLLFRSTQYVQKMDEQLNFRSFYKELGSWL